MNHALCTVDRQCTQVLMYDCLPSCLYKYMFVAILVFSLASNAKALAPFLGSLLRNEAAKIWGRRRHHAIKDYPSPSRRRRSRLDFYILQLTLYTCLRLLLNREMCPVTEEGRGLVTAHLLLYDFHQVREKIFLCYFNMKPKPTVLHTRLKNLRNRQTTVDYSDSYERTSTVP